MKDRCFKIFHSANMAILAKPIGSDDLLKSPESPLNLLKSGLMVYLISQIIVIFQYLFADFVIKQINILLSLIRILKSPTKLLPVPQTRGISDY